MGVALKKCQMLKEIRLVKECRNVSLFLYVIYYVNISDDWIIYM